MPTSIFWFRNDLRLHDHPALQKAIDHSDATLFIYIVDPLQYTDDKLGFSRIGPFRRQFIKESVYALKDALREKGSDLIIKRGDPMELIPAMMQNLNISELHCSFEPGYDEQETVQALTDKLQKQAKQVHGMHNNFLIDIHTLPFAIENLPDIFTEFRKKAEKFAAFPEAIPTPHVLPSQLTHNIIDDYVPEWDITVPQHPNAVLAFKGGEQEALLRLENYIWQQDLLKVYKETRNGLIGADYSSKFSPWLAQGCISPRYIYKQVKKYEKERVANQSTYWLIFELLWRDYFRMIAMKYSNRIFLKFGLKGHINKRMENNKAKFMQWVEGKTKEPFVNANMNELRLSGFMSNRGRQNVASYLVNDLKVNWQWGARYFESMLMDYDVSSNWCNWNYVAGIGTDPREDRYFNIRKQSEMYDPDGLYVKLWAD
ncbi:MAG: DASH family cryptochrome [Flavobacteriales bacterium]